MRKYRFPAGDSSAELVTLYRAVHVIGLTGDDLDALADLAVGETYVDADGDTWERVE